MVQSILFSMQVCPRPFIPEPVVGLQIDGAGATDYQNPARIICASIQSGGIKIVDTGSLEIWIEISDNGIGNYDHCWAEIDMGQLFW